MNEEIIRQLDKEEVEKANKNFPEFNGGDTVRVGGRIKEGNRERIQYFDGIVVRRTSGGVQESVTVRRIAYGVGVEKTWPLNSPNLASIEVIRKGKVRRAKLNYLRGRVGKSATKVKAKI